MALEEGQAAPQIELLSHKGEMVRLSDYRGKKVIVYFYPRDMTPGCTTQACDFRDHYEQFEAENTVIMGISTDSAERHRKFIDKYQLPFVLLVDDEHQAAEAYGVWVQKNMFGKKFMGIQRATFVIDEEGKLLKAWHKVKVKDHVAEALAYIQSIA